mmetsp:Transcript_15079/g.24496  ORF Transcript_15079/g.24496 Transcript_15079/m.24496 type:complete len:230 (-) Transcript_15079:1237-1926(-)
MEGSDICYYTVLKISRDATTDEIRRAYKRLAMKYHPDKNPKDREKAEEKFKLVAEAYEVLSDSEQRATYDRFGRAGLNGGGRGHHAGMNSTGMAHARDLFEQFFGNDFGPGGLFGRGGMDSFFSDDFFTSDMPSIHRTRSRGRRSDPFASMFEDMDRMGGGGFSSSQSFSSSFSSMGGGGVSKSVRTTTTIIDGKRVSTTETTITHPDGRVERQIEQGDGRGSARQIQF